MRNGDKKIFLNKENLYLMVNLRINGFAYTTLAILFSCDRTSIQNQCDKYNIVPLNQIYNIERIASTILKESQPEKVEYEVWNGKKYALGKSYQEYLAQDARNR